MTYACWIFDLMKIHDILAWYQFMKISSYLTTLHFCWFPFYWIKESVEKDIFFYLLIIRSEIFNIFIFQINNKQCRKNTRCKYLIEDIKDFLSQGIEVVYINIFINLSVATFSYISNSFLSIAANV